MSRIVLTATDTDGKPFVLTGSQNHEGSLIAANRGTRNYEFQIGAYPGDATAIQWHRLGSSITTNYQELSSVRNRVPFRVLAATAGTTIVAAWGGDAQLYFGPHLTGANITTALSIGDVYRRKIQQDFSLETQTIGGITYSVSSATPAQATATIDDEGNLAITAVAAGSPVVDGHRARSLRY